MQLQRIGIFGGSFNPIHNGHLLMAESARDFLKLQQVLFVPVNKPPHKGSKLLDCSHRVEMVKLAIKGNVHFLLEEYEVQKETVSYTIETVKDLKTKYKMESKPILIIGFDSLLEFNTWKNYTEILEYCDIAVLPRFKSGNIPPELVGKFTEIPMPPIGISATQIRDYLKIGKSIRYMVPEKVYEYIINNGLYRS